ncbi:MAG: hypothetical protein JXR07_14085 [Reichenbachiella sp.]
MRDSITGIPVFSDFWNKYRPVVLKMMVGSENEPQTYQFLRHEFHDVTPTKKSGYSFKLQAFKGRALNNIKTSDLAKSLIIVLQRSAKASELMETITFNFQLDKHFILTVTREAVEEEVVEEEVVEEVTPEEEPIAETEEATPETKEAKEES